MKEKTCAICRIKFTPSRPMQKVCSPACAYEYSRKETAKADQAQFEDYHGKVIAFLRGQHAAPFLWRHLGNDAHWMMDSILGGFNE